MFYLRALGKTFGEFDTRAEAVAFATKAKADRGFTGPVEVIFEDCKACTGDGILPEPEVVATV
jgi:hypothetical protein